MNSQFLNKILNYLSILDVYKIYNKNNNKNNKKRNRIKMKYQKDRCRIQLPNIYKTIDKIANLTKSCY